MGEHFWLWGHCWAWKLDGVYLDNSSDACLAFYLISTPHPLIGLVKTRHCRSLVCELEYLIIPVDINSDLDWHFNFMSCLFKPTKAPCRQTQVNNIPPSNECLQCTPRTNWSTLMETSKADTFWQTRRNPNEIPPGSTSRFCPEIQTRSHRSTPQHHNPTSPWP